MIQIINLFIETRIYFVCYFYICTFRKYSHLYSFLILHNLVCFSLADKFFFSITDSTVSFIFCFIVLGLCSTLLIFSLWNSNTYIPTIRTHVLHLDRQQPLLHTISDKFLSFGLDTSLLRKMNELPVEQKKFINLGRHLSPAYVRVGGTSADCLIFDQNSVGFANIFLFS